MLEQLQTQRQTLQSFLETHRSTEQGTLSPGLKLTMQIYEHILEDAIKILNSMINFIANR